MLIPAAYSGAWAPVFMIVQQLLGDAGFMIFMILSTSLSQKLLPEHEIARANGGTLDLKDSGASETDFCLTLPVA